MKVAVNGHEKQIRDLNREADRRSDEKDIRIMKLEQLNRHMEMVNNELQRKVKMIAVATLQSTNRRCTILSQPKRKGKKRKL